MTIHPRFLRSEYHVDPLGLDETEPRFSWLLEGDRRGARQTAYQIVVASSVDRLARDDGDLWDSGRVDSDATAQITYAGCPLSAFESAWWKVRVWDGDGAASAWSTPGRFELGPLTVRDWTPATFIRSSVVGDVETSAPAPYLRRRFQLGGDVVRARLYITALGLYEASINGALVTDELYRPGWTDYHRRVPFQAYDVTELLRPGENVLGAILGDGWYCGFVVRRRQVWGDRPELLAKLVIEVADAEEAVVIVTDADWRTATGPILLSDNYDGETYDARLELTGWNEPGYDDSEWEPVSAPTGSSVSVVATVAPPVRSAAELQPTSVTRRRGGTLQFDFGQNLVGRVRLRVDAAAGTVVTLRFAEMLNEDGTLHTENLTTAKATDRYICKGDAEELYEPRFTFHGFRYVEVSGADVAADAVTAVVLHSDAPLTGDFSCSNELVNRLQQNIQWSQRGNFLDVPTDCPQRAERLGWTGDIQMFARAATYNMDVAAFLSKYVTDLGDSQRVAGVDRGSFPRFAPSMFAGAGGPGWADAGVIVPWVLYERYGDVRLLERHYSAVLEYIEFLDRSARGRTQGTSLGFGDWLSLDPELLAVPGMQPNDDRWGGTPREFLWRAFDAYSTGLAAEMAAVLSRTDDARRLDDRRDRVRETFEQEYVGWDGHLTVTTQTAYVVALQFDLLGDPEHRRAAADDLVARVEHIGHLETGLVGTPYLLHVLSGAGRTDLAYRLLERTEYPGWLYPVTQGATTIWERWDGWTTESGFKQDAMNSFNHYAYGAVGEWLFRVVAGIDTMIDRPGYQHVLIRPEPGGTLTSAAAHLDTIRGRIATAWQLDGNRLTLRIELPVNVRALVRLPASAPQGVSENGVGLTEVEGIDNVGLRAGRVECEADAGVYDLVIDDPLLANRPASRAR